MLVVYVIKLSDLQALLSVTQPGLVFVTESWLDESIANGMIDPSDSFAVYRHDRAVRVGGGVLALVSKQLNSYQLVLKLSVLNLQQTLVLIVLSSYIALRILMQSEETMPSGYTTVSVISVTLIILLSLLVIYTCQILTGLMQRLLMIIYIHCF